MGKSLDSADEAEGSIRYGVFQQPSANRSLAMHPAIAEKLRAEPGLLAIARENLNRWQDQAGRSRPYLEEWRRIPDFPLEDLFALIGQDNAQMAALRQSSPFAGVLKPAERWAIYEAFEPARLGATGFGRVPRASRFADYLAL